MIPVLESFSYVRVLGVFGLLLVVLPMIADRPEDSAADSANERSGALFMRAASAFVRACFLIELLAVALGRFRLSYPGTIITCYLAALAMVALICRRKTLRPRELIHQAVYRAMVLMDGAGVGAGLARRLAVMAREKLAREKTAGKFIPASFALFALLVGVTALERTWFAVHDARFTRSETYDRALALGEMVNSGARGVEASVALLAPVVCLTGLDPATVIRFTGPIFAILLAAAAALCAFRICGRFWVAYLAFGLVAAAPLLLGESNPGEVPREQIAALFALLGATFAFDGAVTALMAAALTIGIEPRAGVVVLSLIACVAVSAALGKLIEALPSGLRILVTPCIVAALIAVPSSMIGRETPDGPFQYESAAQACLKIRYGFPRNSWLVISPGYERAFTADYGWHMELLSFVTNYTPDQVENPSFRFGWPVQDVFVLVEKQPLCAVEPAVQSGAAIMRMAHWNSAAHGPAGCKVDPARASLEFDAAEIIAGYARHRSNVSIFQEDEHLTVYRLDLSK
jgi:hypothetical protein